MRLVRNALRPVQVRAHFEAMIEDRLADARIAPADDPFNYLASITSMIRSRIAFSFTFLLPQFIPLLGPGMAAINVLNKIAESAISSVRVESNRFLFDPINGPPAQTCLRHRECFWRG